MQFRLITAEEAGRFDGFMRGTPNGHLFQSYAWGEVKKPAWSPLRVVLERDGRIVAAASILKRKIPFPGKSLFYLPRGPVLADWSDSGVFQAFMTNLQQLAVEHRAILIKIDPCLTENQNGTLEFLDKAGFTEAREKHEFGGIQPRYTFRLDISRDLEEIMKSFHKKIRYKIRYGPNRGLKFKNPGEEGIVQFMEVMQETGQRGGFVVRKADYFRKLYRLLKRTQSVNLTLGYYEGQVVTAAITAAFGDKAWAFYGGQINRYRNLYAYHAMIWERIKWAKSQGACWFDFNGVPGRVDEKHPLYGIYHFKKSFGGDYFAFAGERDLAISPFYYWLWTRLFPPARAVLLMLLKLGRSLRPRNPFSGKALTKQQ